MPKPIASEPGDDKLDEILDAYLLSYHIHTRGGAVLGNGKEIVVMEKSDAKAAILALFKAAEIEARLRENRWARRRPHGGQAGSNELEDRRKELQGEGDVEPS